MNSEFLKKIVFFLIICLVIVLIAIILFSVRKEKSEIVQQEETGENVFENYGKSESGGVERYAYFDIKKCMQLYLNYLNIDGSQYYSRNEDGKYVRYADESYIKQNIYNLLSNKYIANENITIDNLYDKIDVLKEATLFVPLEASMIRNEEIKSFLVYGLIEKTSDYSVIRKIFAVINVDIHGQCFSIEPIHGDYNSISEIKIEQFEDTITANKLNKYSMSSISTQDMLKEYIIQYKRLAFGAPEELYKCLDEEYKNLKFGSLENFKNYIELHKSEITSARLEKYKIDYEDGISKYICIDQYENNYIINEKVPLQNYTLMLDTYTVNIKEFIDKYDTSENNIKVALNIEKLIDATKDGDYKYVYSKLDDTFKASNFGTQEKFEKYIKEKFDPENDTITYGTYKEAGGTHIYNIEVKDVNENKKIYAKIVMKLKDDRDFVLSFSAENLK